MIFRTRQPAFTFLELILAMAMVSMLALSLYASLRIGFKARDTATRAIGPVRATEIAASLIQRDLESALPPTGILAGPFIGQLSAENALNTSALEYYCLGQGPEHPDPTGQGGIRRINLLVTTLPDGTPNVLVRQITSNLLALSGAEYDQEVLCRGVRTFALQYWDGTTWQDTWDSTELDNSLPIAVHLTLAIDWPAPRTNTTLTNGPPTHQIVRTIRLACYRDMQAEAAASTTTGATGGATGGASSGSSQRAPASGGASQGGGR